MEVDGVDNSSPQDEGNLENLKLFVTAAREYQATHSESAANMMTRYLSLIASSCDGSIFFPGRSEVCAFFSSLWRVMCDGRGIQWAGVTVLARAAMEPSARHALTHTYKFMPILAGELSDSLSTCKTIKLLSVMQELSYGIKISWQESYLARLIRQLTNYITQLMTDPANKAIGRLSLTILVNLCYGNLPAIYALMRNVDTKEFVVHLISLRDSGYGGVEVCRLLLCLSEVTRTAATSLQEDIHCYLLFTMRSFYKAIVNRDAAQLQHAYIFINDLCNDTNLQSFVLTYPSFTENMEIGLKDVDELCLSASNEMGEPDNTTNSQCLRHVLKFLTVLVSSDLCSLRCHHAQLVCLCMKASRVTLPESLELFTAIVIQSKVEDSLPEELVSVVRDGLPELLVPPALEPGKAGLQWIQMVNTLCELSETQERVLQEVTADAFESTLYSLLQYNSQMGSTGQESSEQAVVVGCRTALSLASLSSAWESALARILTQHQVKKLLCASFTSNNVQRRKEILQLIKHHYFSSDQMSEVFSEFLQTSNTNDFITSSIHSINTGTCCGSACSLQRSLPDQELVIDKLMTKLNDALAQGKVEDIATSSVMELYGYKITCLEQRLHSYSADICVATGQMATLHHALATLQATNSSQQDVLYTTQKHNERHKNTIDYLKEQLQDTKTTLQAKLAAEQRDNELQRENINKEFKNQLSNIEKEMETRERDAAEKLRVAEDELKTLQMKLKLEAKIKNELTEALSKVEERVKQQDKLLEKATTDKNALNREILLKATTIKQLEKTVLQHENKLCQVSEQLEEMKKVKEMVAKLVCDES